MSMEQSELGKNEEIVETTSSAELSESMTAAASQGAPETPSASIMDATDEGDSEVAAGQTSPGTDDEDTEGPEESGGLRRGQVVEGKISRTTPNEIYVDLGEGREGIVPKKEVENMTARVLEGMKAGTTAFVYVVNPHNHRGEIILSISHAQEELDWRTAAEYLESKEVFDGKIGGYNKGGLIVRFGRLRGFVPQSQIGDKRLLDVQGDTPEDRYKPMVNQTISVKVMEVDRSRNRLILSERAAMREVRQRMKTQLIEELKVGEVRTGRVVSLENFGAFVDVGGAEGLVHITELSWHHVTHPRQMLEIGQEVQVRVISVDDANNRIGLSIKQLEQDPWDDLAVRFAQGALVRGTVTKLTKFGAFASIEGYQDVEGLIHISELSDDRVEHPKDVVHKGDVLTLRVVKVDVKDRRLGLSLRRVNSAEYLDLDMERAYAEMENRADASAASPAS